MSTRHCERAVAAVIGLLAVTAQPQLALSFPLKHSAAVGADTPQQGTGKTPGPVPYIQFETVLVKLQPDQLAAVQAARRTDPPGLVRDAKAGKFGVPTQGTITGTVGSTGTMDLERQVWYNASLPGKAPTLYSIPIGVDITITSRIVDDDHIRMLVKFEDHEPAAGRAGAQTPAGSPPSMDDEQVVTTSTAPNGGTDILLLGEAGSSSGASTYLMIITPKIVIGPSTSAPPAAPRTDIVGPPVEPSNTIRPPSDQ